MSDRLTEIRARLDAATPWIDGTYDSRIRTEGAHRDYADWLGTAPADIAWLLEEVDNLNTTLNEWMAFCGSKECGLQRKAGAA